MKKGTDDTALVHFLYTKLAIYQCTFYKCDSMLDIFLYKAQRPFLAKFYQKQPLVAIAYSQIDLCVMHVLHRQLRYF